MKFRVMAHTCKQATHLENCQDNDEFKVNLGYMIKLGFNRAKGKNQSAKMTLCHLVG